MSNVSILLVDSTKWGELQHLYGKMQVLGQPRPVSLEGIYTAVSLLDRPAALSRYTVEEMQADFTGRGRRYFYASDEEARRDGLDMVKRGDNLFILGKPGAGKTTFLKHVALRGVSGDLERVPIFVGLKQLSDSGLSVFDFVVQEFDVCDFPDAAAYLNRLLKAGKAVLLFDGLDEVNVADDERRSLIADVERFTRKYDQCQRLITCRLAANDYLFEGYTYVEMADFDETQIREFVGRWFSGDKLQRERRELFLSELDKAESEGLRELARVPLLLALLCLGFEETLRLSSRRVELYEEALDALLKKWDSGRNIRRDDVYRDLTIKRKEGMLAQVAAETFDRGEYFIPRETLARSFEAFLAQLPDAFASVDGDLVLQAIIAQHGLFHERARDIFSFAHLTFQEYFMARYTVENEARGTLIRLIDHYREPRYREVFLLTAAQLPDASMFFDLFLKRLADEAQRCPAVADLLRRAARKTATASGTPDGINAIRSLYVFIEFARDLDLANTDVLDLDLTRARVRALDLADGPSSVFIRDLALVYCRLFARVAERSESQKERLESLGVAGTFDDAAAVQSGRLGDSDTQRRLVRLGAVLRRRPSPTREDLQSVVAELDAVLTAHDLDFPVLDDEDGEALERYLAGNRFLLECLEQAVVDNRETIKERLLLLPEE